MIEKIVESGLKTYYKEVSLLEQAFIHDDKKTVAQALKEAEGKVGGPVKVTGFVRYALGEGIEKQESDFAAEVAAASGQEVTVEVSIVRRLCAGDCSRGMSERDRTWLSRSIAA